MIIDPGDGLHPSMSLFALGDILYLDICNKPKQIATSVEVSRLIKGLAQQNAVQSIKQYCPELKDLKTILEQT
jgi:hypothetical protein